MEETPASGVPSALARLSPSEARVVVRWAKAEGRREERDRWLMELDRLSHDMVGRIPESSDPMLLSFAVRILRSLRGRMTSRG